jgi:DNA-binding HxlR family transcriptional regulator
MQRKSFGNMQCPVARSLERVGEWWSILILRDAFAGMTRFDEFQKSLAIAPNILTRRLTALVEAGMLERRLYCERPPRHEYVLTARGRDFRPVLISLQVWGNKHFAPEGPSVMLVDARTGAAAEPMLVDRLTGQPITDATHRNAAGPAAGARVKKRLAAQRKSAKPKPAEQKPAEQKPAEQKPASAARAARARPGRDPRTAS